MMFHGGGGFVGDHPVIIGGHHPHLGAHVVLVQHRPRPQYHDQFILHHRDDGDDDYSDKRRRLDEDRHSLEADRQALSQQREQVESDQREVVAAKTQLELDRAALEKERAAFEKERAEFLAAKNKMSGDEVVAMPAAKPLGGAKFPTTKK